MKIIKEMKSEIEKLLIYYFPRKNLGQVEVNFIRWFTTYINYTSSILYSIILISYKIRLITDQSKLEQVCAVWIARFVYVRQK